MGEFVVLERSPDFIERAEGVSAPMLCASTNMLSVLDDQGKTLTVYEGPLLAGLKETQIQHASAIALDGTSDPTSESPEMDFKWDDYAPTPVHISIPLTIADRAREVTVNRELNTLFWLGTLVGDAISSGRAAQIDNARVEKTLVAVSPLIGLGAGVGCLACLALWRHSGPDAIRGILGVAAGTGFGTYKFKEHLSRVPSDDYLKTRFVSKARELGEKHAALHVGHIVEARALAL